MMRVELPSPNENWWCQQQRRNYTGGPLFCQGGGDIFPLTENSSHPKYNNVAVLLPPANHSSSSLVRQLLLFEDLAAFFNKIPSNLLNMFVNLPSLSMQETTEIANLFVIATLLAQCGDIESNPGPKPKKGAEPKPDPQKIMEEKVNKFFFEVS